MTEGHVDITMGITERYSIVGKTLNRMLWEASIDPVSSGFKFVFIMSSVTCVGYDCRKEAGLLQLRLITVSCWSVMERKLHLSLNLL